MTEKSILEQALLQVQTLEEAVKQNAKGILASTMKEELNELLKESEEEVEVDEQSEDSLSMDEPKEEEENDMSEQPVADDEEGEDESEDDEENLDNEPSKDIDSMDSEDGEEDDEFTATDDSMDDETSMDDMDLGGDDVMDMTDASDEEVLKVFKAMKPEDGIVVKKDGSNVELETGDDEYIIKLDEEEDEEVSEEKEWGDSEMHEEDVEVESDEVSEEDETIYEIELDEEEDEESEEDAKEVEATEAARTFANDVRKPANQGKKFKAGRPELNEEVETLKKQNSEYRQALVLFKDKLNEVAIFNANLAHATRLFTEHSTTKQEKLNILKRFDSVSTMNESKSLFNTIKSELDTKKPVTESVVDKISNTPTTSTSQEVLAESKAYENPQFRRMKDLMSKLK
jgi:hypothetical protein